MAEKEEKQEIIFYKILLLGNSSVGKTSFFLRFCDDKFDPGLFVDEYKIKYLKRHNKPIELGITDTSGNE